MPKKHPIQPLELDETGVLRFKENKIVRYILDNGGINIDQITCLTFPREDREQFAQLIGYSHSGSGDLYYMSEAVWLAALLVYEKDMTEEMARKEVEHDTVSFLKEKLVPIVCELFRIHPNDLKI